MNHHIPLAAALLAGALQAASAQQAADPKTYLDPIKAELRKEWPANRMVTIVCHGHSVPAGYFRTPVVNSLEAYPHLLHVAIKAKYPFAVVNVIVTAIGGENSESGAARFERDVLSHRPDVLLIDYSLNDRGIGLERARKAWTQMVAAAKEKGVKVILMTPTADTGAKLADPNDPLCQHAEQVRAIAREQGVGLVDSLALYRDYVAKGGKVEDLLSQVNHPNRKGHDMVAAEAAKWFD